MKNSRYEEAFSLIAHGILLSLVFGAIFALIFWTPFWECALGIFLVFSAPGIVGALLIFITPIQKGLAYGFGCGLYYGTALPIIFLCEQISNTFLLCFLSILVFSVVCIVCYVVWKKFFRFYSKDL